MIGPEPSLTLQNRLAWTKLQNLIGLEAVKQFVQALFDSIQYNYCRELEEKPLVEYSLFHHRNLDACAPPAPRDPAPLLLRRRSQDPAHQKSSTFNEGPERCPPPPKPGVPNL
jgi:hypothetical protein